MVGRMVTRHRNWGASYHVAGDGWRRLGARSDDSCMDHQVVAQCTHHRSSNTDHSRWRMDEARRVAREGARDQIVPKEVWDKANLVRRNKGARGITSSLWSLLAQRAHQMWPMRFFI